MRRILQPQYAGLYQRPPHSLKSALTHEHVEIYPKVDIDTEKTFDMPPPSPDQVCVICRPIMSRLLTTDLPWEDEPAIPHQPNLIALGESSQSCSFCFQVWLAAGWSLGNRGGGVAFMPKKKIGETEVSIQAANSNFIGGGMFRAMANGAVVSMIGNSIEPDMSKLDWVHPATLVADPHKYGSYLFGNWYQSPYQGQEKRLLLIGLGVRLGTSPSIGDAIGNKPDEWFLAGSYLRVRTKYDSEVSHIIPGCIRNWDLSSERAFGQVKAWLKICDAHHQCLKSNDDASVLPTRVLCIDPESERVYLKEPQGQKARYVALSHSWGKSHRLTLTSSNLATLKNGINKDDIPQTFKDAVIICRSLGIEYLWIDSLCIIQNDTADWEHEASRMSDLYTNSYFTISALHSADDSEGCFPSLARKAKDKPYPFVSPDVTCTGRPTTANAVPFVIPKETISAPVDSYNHAVVFSMHGESEEKKYFITSEWMPPSIESHLKRCGTFNFGANFDPLKVEPLSKRGWVLQERLLSRRTLHYGEGQMYWECQNIVLGEDGSMLQRLFPQLQTIVDSRQKAMQPQDSEYIRDEWLGLVEVFSTRKLTMDYDKLVAISGLASIVAEKSGDQYHAGVWKSNFLNGLCWKKKIFVPTHHCSGEEHEHALPEATTSTLVAPSQYRAPSWSWASIDGEIEFDNIWLNNKEAEVTKMVARLLEVSVTPLGPYPFGGVESGLVRLETVVGECHILDTPPEKPAGQILDTFHVAATLSGISTSRNEDTVDSETEETKKHGLSNILSGLTLSEVSPSSTLSISAKISFDIDQDFPCIAAFISCRFALVLKQGTGSSEGCYLRIGIAEFAEAETKDFIKSSQRSQVVIM